jgi:L-amino acid N-acyltransferase YncA
MSSVRPVGLRDLDAVAAIYAHYVTRTVATFDEEPPSAAAWIRRLDLLAVRNLPFLVAADGSDIVGFAYCMPWRGSKPSYRHTGEDTVYVAPGAVGRGIGRRLLTGLLEHATRAGVRQVIAVVVDSGEPAALRLHEGAGFTNAGRLVRVGHKHGRWLDTILLQRELPATQVTRR